MQIGVLENNLSTLSGQLVVGAVFIEESIVKLNFGLESLSVSWTGTASQAFAADRAKWTDAALALADVLRQIASMLTYSVASYSDAETKNAQTLGGSGNAGGFAVDLDTLTGFATALESENAIAGDDATSLYGVYNAVAGNPLAFPKDDQWHSVSDLLLKVNEGLQQAIVGTDLLTRALVQVEQNYTNTEGQLSTMFSEGWSHLFFDFSAPAVAPLPNNS